MVFERYRPFRTRPDTHCHSEEERRGNLLVHGHDIGNPKATVGGLFHSSPRFEKSHVPPGDSHVASLLGMTYFLRFPKYRYRCVVVTGAAGARPRPTVCVVTLYHSTGGLPRQCALLPAMTAVFYIQKRCRELRHLFCDRFTVFPSRPGFVPAGRSGHAVWRPFPARRLPRPRGHGR